MMNMVSTTRTWEACSTDSRNNANNKRKRPRHEDGATSSKYKGVVLQQNRHWGAQIYANHQRIWLGTFKTEKEAAMAYDSAATKLRSNDTHRNFPWSSLTIQEPYFQKDYSTEAILNMIKEGSYPSKFENFVRSQSLKEDVRGGATNSQLSIEGKGKMSCRQLFQKELTPSDVGKLNRLVIPKKYAVEHFPRFVTCENEKDADKKKEKDIATDGGKLEDILLAHFPRFVTCENEKDIATDAGKLEDVLLTFYDRLMRTWEFRYCYWKSSQSYVFTRGWNRFVKEKQLQANDTVTFYICEPMEKAVDHQPFYLIDVSYKPSSNNNNNGRMVQEVTQFVEQQSLHKDAGQSNGNGLDSNKDVVVEENLDLRLGRRNSFRLFGVQISSS